MPFQPPDFPTEPPHRLQQSPTGSSPQGRQTFWQRIAGLTPSERLILGIGAGCSALIVVCLACSALSLALGGSNSPQRNGVIGLAATATATDTDEPTATVEATATHVQSTSTPRSHATNTPCASPCNPWGYNFNAAGGTKITNPSSAFCSYFACIGNPPSYTSFWNGKGYVMECKDTKFSRSGGTQNSCSQHGGDWRTLYAH